MASPSGSSPLTALPPDAVPALTAAGTIKVAKACQNCKRRKKRCDGNGLVPCDRCTKLGDTCVYVAEKKRGPKKKDDMTAAAAVAAAVPCDTPSSASTASAPNPNGAGRDSMSTAPAPASAALPTPPDAALASPRSSSASTLPAAASTTSSSSGDLTSLLTPSSASAYTSSAAGSYVDLPYLPGIQPSPMPVPRSLVTPVPMSAQQHQQQQIDPYQALASSFSTAPPPPPSLPHAPLTHGGDEAYQVAGAVLDAWPDFPAVPEPGSAEAAAIVQALRAPDRKRARNNLGTSQPAPTPDLGLGDFAAALDALSEFIGPDGASGAVLSGANASTPADLLASIMASSTMAPTTPTPAFACRSATRTLQCWDQQ
ncbi:hypothetical protein AMAG_03985 [Allomyces macrogynus ATCC 38327]|uniref:Zn(2)-C6 fungal-type domain-containing protein n=1 Tax=Allomyces macrogynus (strain ATCC 38327) TaxID=578462 RepID=A0A0L0S7L0_ALLM3|nr:hypothetical protein AMAG_03985 [Allomyces macrogynus ATCC 38327]|eukprot:KNE58410.1 hypothetical protein AMAG_03985 [Allomyces macrogynus ATCC 38327]